MANADMGIDQGLRQRVVGAQLSHYDRFDLLSNIVARKGN